MCNANAIEIAAKWRKKNNKTGTGGIVVIYAGSVQSWVNKLRNPEHWQPGAIAIDENCREWWAAGGNERSGAERWQQIN